MPPAGAPRKPPLVLVVDDDEGVRRLLNTILIREQYRVVLAADGDQALDLAVDQPPDVVILDLKLPGLSGLDVCRQLRSWLAAPILVLSGLGDQSDKIAALDLGADDYITKPFAPGEMLARLRALLRRASAAASPAVIEAGDLKIDRAQRRVSRGGREIRLTRTQFELLACLAQNVNCVVTSRMLLNKVWGPDSGDDTQTLRVHIGLLRRKVEPDPAIPRYIRTESGIGYRLTAAVAVAAGSG